MPPYSFGDCGAHRPAFFALSRTGSSRASGMFSCSEKFDRIGFERQHLLVDEGAHAQAEVFDLGRECEVHGPYALDLNDLAAVDDDASRR